MHLARRQPEQRVALSDSRTHVPPRQQRAHLGSRPYRQMRIALRAWTGRTYVRRYALTHTHILHTDTYTQVQAEEDSPERRVAPGQAARPPPPAAAAVHLHGNHINHLSTTTHRGTHSLTIGRTLVRTTSTSPAAVAACAHNIQPAALVRTTLAALLRHRHKTPASTTDGDSHANVTQTH